VTNAHKLLLLGTALVLTGCASAPTERTTAPVEAATPTEEPVAEITPDYASMRITIAGAGDIMLGTDFPENHLPDDDGAGFLAAVTPALTSVDIAFGNL